MGNTRCPSAWLPTDGRQHAVAIEQRQAQKRGHADEGLGGARYGRAVGQRRQRHHPAFAVIVGAQDQENIFERHHHDQRPEDQRDAAVNRRRVGTARRLDRCLHGVERAGADITEHDAQRAEGERKGAPGGRVCMRCHERECLA
jgi:hypothetical protein